MSASLWRQASLIGLATALLLCKCEAFLLPVSPPTRIAGRYHWLLLPRLHDKKPEDEGMEIWCDCRRLFYTAEKSSTFEKRSFPSFDAFLMNSGDDDDMELLLQQQPNNAQRFLVEKTENDGQERLFRNGRSSGIVVNIATEKGQQYALSAIGSVEYVVAFADNENDTSNADENENAWLMIPAENLIGAATQSGTKIVFMVDRVQDVVGLSQALQVGVDALCVKQNASPELLEAVELAQEQRREQQQESKSSGSSARQDDEPRIITGACWRMPTSAGSSSSTVVADRVCIDFVRALEPTEGCWIGSSAQVMALVLSEAATSSLVPSRPFRVNAGPVHSYVCLSGDGGGRTKYLCELEAGDEVLVYNAASRESRSVAVGRLKIEVRPCVLVALEQEKDATSDDKDDPAFARGQLFLQQAETVRLGKGDGNCVRVTDLQVASDNGRGDVDTKRQSILLRVSASGTHVGGRYAGKVVEK